MTASPQLAAAMRAQRAYARAQARADQLRRERNDAVRAALRVHSQSEVARAAGLTRGRVGQISMARDADT